MSRYFESYLKSLRYFEDSEGGRWIVREVMGSSAHVVQVRLPPKNYGDKGNPTPNFELKKESNGVYEKVSASKAAINGTGLVLGFDHEIFDKAWNDFKILLNIVILPEPEFSDPPTQSEKDAAILTIRALNESVAKLISLLT